MKWYTLFIASITVLIAVMIANAVSTDRGAEKLKRLIEWFTGVRVFPANYKVYSCTMYRINGWELRGVIAGFTNMKELCNHLYFEPHVLKVKSERQRFSNSGLIFFYHWSEKRRYDVTPESIRDRAR